MTRDEWLQRYVSRWKERGYLLAMDIERYASVFRAWGEQYADHPERVADMVIREWEGQGDLLNVVLADEVGAPCFQ